MLRKGQYSTCFPYALFFNSHGIGGVQAKHALIVSTIIIGGDRHGMQVQKIHTGLVSSHLPNDCERTILSGLFLGLLKLHDDAGAEVNFSLVTTKLNSN